MSRIVWPNPYNPTFEEHQRVIEEMTNTTRDYPPELFDQKAAENALSHLPIFIVGYSMPNRSIRVRWSIKSEEDRMPLEVARDIVWAALEPIRHSIPGVERVIVSQTTASLVQIANEILDIIYHE